MYSKLLTRELTSTEMLDLWRLVRHFEPLRADAEVTRTDGVDLDALLEEELKGWYARQYSELPAWQLPQCDFTSETEMWRTADGIGVINIPDRCVLPTDIIVEGWERAATIVDAETPLALDQTCRFTRGGSARPVAVVSGRQVRLYTLPTAGADLERFAGVALPEPGTYLVTNFMLPEIFDF